MGTTTPTRMEPAPLDERADQVMVPMRDGVRLATDIYLPPRPAQLPSILIRLPYDKSGSYACMPALARLVGERGFAFVVQDVRGKFRSEGGPGASLDAQEAKDGYDTLEWIAAQPWSDGAVGMAGESYYGLTQWMAAASGHPALKAIVPHDIAPFDLFPETVPALRNAVEWSLFCGLDQYTYVDFKVDYSQRPLADLVFNASGRRPRSFEILRLGMNRLAVEHALDRVTIPVLHSGGWWDDMFQRDQVEGYLVGVANGLPRYLLMNSTDHYDCPLREHGAPSGLPADFADVDAAIAEEFLSGYMLRHIEFLERYVAGREGAVPAVRWHVGNEGWRVADQWPPRGSSVLRLYLVDAGRATSGAAGGGLSSRAASRGEIARWVHDPNDLVPSEVQEGCDEFMAGFAPLMRGMPDESSIEERDDVLTFTGEPVESQLILAGPVRLTAALESSASSMHLVAKLMDVSPDGSSRRILWHSRVVDRPDPDSPVTLHIGHIGYRLRPGHRLRLHVASSAFPFLLWHPGTDEDPWLATTGQPNHQVLHTAGGQSYVEVSVMGEET